MEIIHVLVSMSLSGITQRHRPYGHTLDNSHQALSVYQLCPAFLLREAVPGLPVTHICAEFGFPQLTRAWPTSLFFYFSKAWEKVFDWIMSLLNTRAQHLPTLCFRLNRFYSGTLLVCCREQWRNFLVRFLCADYGFPSTTVTTEIEASWDTQTQSATERCVRNERKWGLIPNGVIYS